MSPVKSPQETRARGVGKKDKIVVEKDEAEELLPGWTKEVKVRKTGSATKVDRYYTDPVTGYIFRSLKDVQRYLKTGELGRLAIKPKIEEKEKTSELKEQTSETVGHKRSPTDKSEIPPRASKRLAGGNNDELLPSPQLSPSLPEPKTRHATRLAGIKVDAPPPPSSSPPDPKTRQATRLAEVAVDASLKSPSPPEPKTRQATRLAGVAVDAPPPSPSPLPSEPKTHQSIRLTEMAADASPSVTRTNHQATRQSGTKIDASVSSPPPPPPAPKTRQAARQAGIKIDSPPPLPPDSKARQATPLTGTESGPSPPSQPEPKTRQAKRLYAIRDNASPQPKTRRATREAGIKINSPPPSPPDTRTSRQATRTRLVNSATSKENKKTDAEKTTDNRNENGDMEPGANSNQENNEKQEPCNILPPVTSKEHNKQIEMGPTSPSPTAVIPPVNLEKQKSPVINPTISNPFPQDSYSYGNDMKPDSSSISFSMNDLWSDPCIEFAVKTLTGAIPFTDLNKVENFTAPSEVPLQDIWTDPCIEFAVKTLTGAIPVGQDDYFLNRPASSANPPGPHNFSSPMNVCQTGHKNKQQDSMFPTLGNGGLQKPGKFVNGSNGQCSRSRFYQ